MDRPNASSRIINLISLLGKPIYLIIIGFISFIYFLILLINQIKLHFRPHIVSKRTSSLIYFKSIQFRFTTSVQKKLTKRKLALATHKQPWYQSFKNPFPPIETSSKKITHFINSFVKYLYEKLKKFFRTIFLIRSVIAKAVLLKLKPRFSLPVKITFHPFRFSLIILFLAGSYLFYSAIIKDLPHPKSLLEYRPPVTTKIYDRHHRPLYQFFQDENRSIISLSQVPPHVISATLAIEDSEFYQHPGFSIKGIFRAFHRNLQTESLQGGSTITQQLIKNTLLTPERTLTRKLKELILAVAVESYFTKDEILTMYLNQVGYGGPAYGIEAASQMYLGKSISDVSLAEAALIAGLPASPTTYSPFGNHPELAFKRQQEVLRRMTEENYITASQAALASSKTITFASPNHNISAPHFVMYIKDYLVNLFGEDQVNQGGLNVTTTLDLDIQELAEVTLNQELESLKRLNIHNAAVIITQPHTGEILAMVGSKNYFDTENDGQVNVVLRPRQPGSSIKPVNYAYALEHGFTASTLIDDSPVVYTTAGSPPYSPKNYDGRFHGKVTLRQALANSYNIPAVKTLNQFGVINMVSIGQNLGISTWNNPSRFGLALTLGGGEVTLADMAVVYGTFANAGQKVPLNPLLTVTDYTNHNYTLPHCPMEDSTLAFTSKAQAATNKCIPKKVISPETAYILSDILSDNQARSSAFGSNSVLQIPGHQVAVKTGTTNNLRDNWTIGYTQDFVVGVWVGNNDNTPMSYVASGITGASPIWSKIMTALLIKSPPHSFTQPENIIAIDICPTTGTRNCGRCPNPRTEFYTKGTEPKISCNDHFFTSPEKFQAN